MLGSKKQKIYSRTRYSRRKVNLSGWGRFGAKALSGVFIMAFLSLVCVFGYSVITQCDYLKADKIYVTGEKQLSKQDVLKQAKAAPGINILAANLGVVRKRLLAHPDIIAADVGRVFPKTLYINIEEHQPLAIVDFENRYVMNTQGEIYKKYNGAEPAGLPLVTGLSFSDFGKDTGRKPNPHRAVMQILKLAPHDRVECFEGTIKEIHVDRQMGITLYMQEPDRVIKLGYGDYREKLNTLHAVLKHMEGKYHLTGFCSVDMMKNDCVVLSPISIKASDLNSEEV